MRNDFFKKKNIFQVVLTVMVGWSAVCFVFQAPVKAQPPEIRIGVLAKRGEEIARLKWQPTIRYLESMNSDLRFQLVPLGFDEIIPAVENKEIDFVLTNSAYYVRLEVDYGVQRIVTLKNKRLDQTTTRFGGVIFSRADSNINGCEDLVGKSFMAVDHRSFGGWLMAQYHLQKHGIDPESDFKKLTFGGTHDAVVYAVRDGLVDAGTVRTDTLERMAREGKVDLKKFKVTADRGPEAHFPFIVTTALYPEWPLAVLPHVDDDIAVRVSISLLKLSPDHEAAIKAKIIGWTNPHNYQAVHDCLKALRVAPYETYGLITWQESVRQHWLGYAILIISIFGALVFVFYFRMLNKRYKVTVLSLDRKLKENKRLENSLQQFKMTLDQTLDCVFMFSPNDLRFFYVNQGAMNQVGYTAEELYSMTPWDIKPQFTRVSFEELVAPLVSGQMSAIQFETIHRHKNGNEIPVEVFLQYVDLEEGESRFLAIVHDISKRLAASSENDRLQEQLSNALEIAHLGPWEYDVVNDLFTFNDHFYNIFRTTANEVGGYKMRAAEYAGRFVHPDDLPIVGKEIKKSVETTDPHFSQQLEHRILYADGTVGYISVRIFVVKDAHGKTIKTYGVNQDITKRKLDEEERNKLQTQLLHAQKLESVGQLAAGIAHEINTPTQFINSNIEFMEEAYQDISGFIAEIRKINQRAPKEIKNEIEKALEDADWEYLEEELPEAISQSQEGVKRVSSIVLAVKEFSHPGGKEKELQDLNKIIETTTIVARNEWKYVAELETDLDPKLPHIPLLADEMGQVVLNMLVNAAHAITDNLGDNHQGRQGKIIISTKKVDGKVELRIGDNGAGIPEASQARIFDPFYTTKEVGKGTGQGLAISHDVITQKHGGTIDFTTSVGEGTEFIIRLPIALEEVKAAA